MVIRAVGGGGRQPALLTHRLPDAIFALPWSKSGQPGTPEDAKDC